MSQLTERITLITSLSDVSAEDWNALAGDNPAIRHEYLHGLETYRCASPQTGWSPHHLLLYRNAALVGAMPLYLKSHSRGEYVFDHAWAHAFERHGLSYYPKLVCAIPFTPVPGPRLLAHQASDKRILLQAAAALANDNNLSSLHILFPHDDDLQLLSQSGFMIRKNIQFHWSNQAYSSMDDYLLHMNQRNRKKTRQSRRKLDEAGVHFQWIEGADINDQILDFFYRCYCQTYLEHGNAPYLNQHFFQHLRNTMPHQLMMILAWRGQEMIACAMNLRDRDRLYGRYWGSLQAVPGLHFETCYMQSIEYCITHGLKVFEGGAQGEHKLARGLLPVQTHSAHWIGNPQFAHAIEVFLEEEGSAIDHYAGELNAHSPFRQKNT